MIPTCLSQDASDSAPSTKNVAAWGVLFSLDKRSQEDSALLRAIAESGVGVVTTRIAKALKPMQIITDMLTSFLRGSQRSASHNALVAPGDVGLNDALKFSLACKGFVTADEAEEISAWQCPEGGGVSAFVERAFYRSFQTHVCDINTTRLQPHQGRATKADKRNSNKSDLAMGVGEMPHVSFVAAAYEFDVPTVREYVTIGPNDDVEKAHRRKNAILLVLLGLYHALHSARQLTAVTGSFRDIVGHVSPGPFAEALMKTTKGFLSDFERDCVSARFDSTTGGNGPIPHARARSGDYVPDIVLSTVFRQFMVSRFIRNSVCREVDKIFLVGALLVA